MKWDRFSPKIEVDGRLNSRSLTIGVALGLLHAAIAAWSMVLLL